MKFLKFLPYDAVSIISQFAGVRPIVKINYDQCIGQLQCDSKCKKLKTYYDSYHTIDSDRFGFVISTTYVYLDFEERARFIFVEV